MITFGRAGYPKNIPRDTVDKLCTKMYPPFANRGKKTAAGAGGQTDFSMVSTAAFMAGVGGACMHQQILRRSFSAVSTPIFATKRSCRFFGFRDFVKEVA